MGNEANSIQQQSTASELAQCKTWGSALAHLPKTKYPCPESEPLGLDMKKSLPKDIIDVRKCEKTKTFVTDIEKEKRVKILNSNSSKDSFISKLVSSFEDSSSLIVIERLAKNCKLIPPSHLQSTEYARAAAQGWRTKRRSVDERVGGIDSLEYSPSDQQRRQKVAKPVLNDCFLFTTDEMGLGDIHEYNCTSADRFSVGDTCNYPTWPSFLDNDGRTVSGATAMSELSSSATAFNISLPRSDVLRVSDTVAISWSLGGSTEDSVKHLSSQNCLTCAIYAGKEKGLLPPEFNQQAARVDFTSKLYASSELPVVLPGGKTYSASRNKKLPKRMTANLQVPSSLKVTRAD